MRSESTLCSCAYTRAHFLPTFNPSSPVLPAVHPSSQAVRSVTPPPSPRNVIFHVRWFQGLSFPPFLFFLCACCHPLALQFLPIISPDKRSRKLQMFKEGKKKTKMSGALIPGILGLALRVQDRMNGGHFGLVSVIHASQSDHKNQAALKERVHKRERAQRLTLSTIFESLLPSKSFWFRLA